MTFEQVKTFLAARGLADKVHEFKESSATVELAAHAVGCEPCRIAKTMSFMIGDAPALIVLAGDARVDNSKFKAHFHQKASMLSHELVTELIGLPVGGVCPFGVPENVPVYLDESLKRFETVFPAAGSRNSAVEVTIPQLEEASKRMGWVDVGKIG